jgi:ADP-heptose:LPS heptosyltransferase
MQQLKILLVQLYSNGDCLYATAVARQIKQDYPDSHLTWAIANFCKQIIDGNPYIDDTLIVHSVSKNAVREYRRFRKLVYEQRRKGVWDKVVITNLIDSRQANYDGCIRSAIFRGYEGKINVPVHPVLKLSEKEKQNAAAFALEHNLSVYKQVILFEFAPQSGQSRIDFDFAMNVAEELTKVNDIAIILSSANKIKSTSPRIIDGSTLTLRETAAITHYCTFLLGCSSGITWISTSSAAKQLPMVQLLNPDTRWVNPISRDFERFGISTDSLIELIEFDRDKLMLVLNAAFNNFDAARRIYHQAVPLHFKTTRNIVYNLLCYLQFGSILKHIKANQEKYGHNLLFYKEVLLAILLFPFRLARNLFRKRILRVRS